MSDNEYKLKSKFSKSKSAKPQKKWFIIEGNIGSGKTTLMNLLSKHYDTDCEFLFEPVGLWQSLKDEHGTNILDLFYKDQERWSYTMQSIAFMSRLEDIIKPQIKSLRFSERSVHTDIKVFAENCYFNGKMNKLEWDLYNKWFDWLTNSKLVDTIKPDGFIYIRAEPEVSFERIKKRGRTEESEIPMKYLTDIHERHDDWLLSEDLTTPVLIIDAKKDFLDDNKRLEEIINKIERFIN